jgi:hypothetical protein
MKLCHITLIRTPSTIRESEGWIAPGVDKRPTHVVLAPRPVHSRLQIPFSRACRRTIAKIKTTSYKQVVLQNVLTRSASVSTQYYSSLRSSRLSCYLIPSHLISRSEEGAKHVSRVQVIHLTLESSKSIWIRKDCLNREVSRIHGYVAEVLLPVVCLDG